jgi:tetratricopeptide (TPR) repeat protein
LVFRVFVSSTFSDLISERDALQREVFPRIQDFCRDRGASFQAIDLRWGIAEAAAVQQRTMAICMEELARCQRLSPRPNFIVLLGDRYGWRPLPPSIRADELDAILDVISADDRKSVLSWYRRDDNAAPAKYCLLPRHGDIKGRQEWEAEERAVRLLLADAARRVFGPERASLDKYSDSATHQEVHCGALACERPQDHVFCYFRHIRGLPNGQVARSWRDIQGNAPDEESVGRLAKLKLTLRRLLPRDHVRRYTSSWRQDGPTTGHLARLCADVYDDLTRTISQEIDRFDRRSETEREPRIHGRLAAEWSADFIGRDRELRHLAGYLLSDSQSPLLVLGPQGCGKTALMAKASGLTAGSSQVVFRSIGATPRSTDLQHLLHDMVIELGGKASSRSDESQVAAFHSAAAAAARLKPVVIWLDGLDQLSPAHDALMMRWFPVSLPDNVKLVASATTDGIAGVLDALRSRLGNQAVIELGSLSQSEAECILNTWLGLARRTLQPSQRQAIMSAYTSCPRPQLLRMAFEVARRWRSWDAPVVGRTPMKDCGSIPDALNGLLAWLEEAENHGEVFVGRALGYLAAAREGLAEAELLEVLSHDEAMLRSLRQRSPESPLVAALPPIVWYRLFHDVEFMLLPRAAGDVNTLAFRHQAMVDVVRSRYLADANIERTRRVALAGYFEALPCGPRKADELPWQLRLAQEWDRLRDVLAEVPLAQLIYRRHGPELVQYWAILKEQLACDIAAVYRGRWPGALSDGILPTAVATVLGNLGYARESEQITDAIISHLRDRGDCGSDLAAILGGKAQFLAARNDQAGVKRLLTEALEIYRREGDMLSTASCLSDLAGTVFHERPDESLRLLQEAERIWRDADRPAGVAACLGNQANVCIEIDGVEAALGLQHEAVRLCQELRLPIPTAEHRAGLARMLARAGKLDEAVRNLREAETVFRDYGLVGPLGACLGQMANLLAAQGRPREAYCANEESLRCLRDSGQHVWLATCLMNQAKTCLSMGEYQQGRKHAEEALEELRTCSAPAPVRQDCLRILFELRRRIGRL